MLSRRRTRLKRLPRVTDDHGATKSGIFSAVFYILCFLLERPFEWERRGADDISKKGKHMAKMRGNATTLKTQRCRENARLI